MTKFIIILYTNSFVISVDTSKYVYIICMYIDNKVLRGLRKKSGSVATAKWQILIISAVNVQQTHIFTCLHPHMPLQMCVCSNVCEYSYYASTEVARWHVEPAEMSVPQECKPGLAATIQLNSICQPQLLLLCFAVFRSSLRLRTRVLKFSRTKY